MYQVWAGIKLRAAFNCASSSGGSLITRLFPITTPFRKPFRTLVYRPRIQAPVLSGSQRWRRPGDYRLAHSAFGQQIIYRANRLAQSSVRFLVVRSDCRNSRIAGRPEEIPLWLALIGIVLSRFKSNFVPHDLSWPKLPDLFSARGRQAQGRPRALSKPQRTGEAQPTGR